MAKVTERVQEILDFVSEKPLTVNGEKLLYLPLKELDSSRLPSVIEGLSREDVIATDRVKADEATIAGRPLTHRELHMADVVAGILYLGCGGLDEAHDIVLPYSCPHPELGGTPVLDSPAHSEACYAHAMVHRKEGQHLGELGMIGWNNACYWASQVDDDKEHAIYPTIRKFAIEEGQKLGNNELITAYLKSADKTWNPQRFISLCEDAVAKGDEKATAFCSDVIGFEWRALLDHCNGVVNK